LIERQRKEEEERGSSSSSEEEEDEDPEAKWDVDTILTTHTNTDNHPAIIKTGGSSSRVVRTKQAMVLHKQFKVPVEGLMAEEISVNKKPTKTSADGGAGGRPFQKVEEDQSSSSSGEEGDE
jgi:protein LTV1